MFRKDRHARMRPWYTALDRHVTPCTCCRHALRRPASPSLVQERPERTAYFETRSEALNASAGSRHISTIRPIGSLGRPVALVALRLLERVRGTLSSSLLRQIGLAGTLILLIAASPARASEATKIIERCTHGESLRGFKQSAYRQALEHMPTIVAEYNDPCVNMIRNAELAAAGGGGGGAQAGAGAAPNTPIPLTPAEGKAVESAHRNGATSVPVGGGMPIRPGVVHADIASAVNKLPHSLFAVLAFLIACALVLLGGEARKRVHARRNG